MTDPPFVPAIYEHAAACIGRSPWEVSRDPALLAAAHAAAHERYGHEPVTAGIDLYNIEAEAYGAEVPKPTGNGVPTIAVHPCETADDILDLPPLDLDAGRIPLLLDAAARIRADHPDLAIRVPVAGTFAIANMLMGMDNLMCDLLEEPDDTARALRHLLRDQLRLCEHLQAAGFQPLVFDSGAAPPMLSPATFRETVFPIMRDYFEAAREIFGEPVGLVLGGDTARILEALRKLPLRSHICPFETDQAAWIAGMESRPDILVRINMNSAVLTTGSKDALREECRRVKALAAQRSGATCIGTGVLPYDFDPERMQLLT